MLPDVLPAPKFPVVTEPNMPVAATHVFGMIQTAHILIQIVTAPAEGMKAEQRIAAVVTDHVILIQMALIPLQIVIIVALVRIVSNRPT